MRRICLLVLLCGCHAHQVASDKTTLASPPKQPQVSSERPVRTTPGSMLDPSAMKQIQNKLNEKGVHVAVSGQLDEATQKALIQFQKQHHTAATGMPDYDTLRELGLDPKNIYLGGTDRQSKHL